MPKDGNAGATDGNNSHTNSVCGGSGGDAGWVGAAEDVDPDNDECEECHNQDDLVHDMMEQDDDPQVHQCQ